MTASHALSQLSYGPLVGFVVWATSGEISLACENSSSERLRTTAWTRGEVSEAHAGDEEREAEDDAPHVRYLAHARFVDDESRARGDEGGAVGYHAADGGQQNARERSQYLHAR
jgi:hypothetical protein